MELRPEQVRALDYLRRHGTEAPIASIRQRLAASLEALDAALAAVPAGRARSKPSSASWSVHEIADHLIESHRPAIGQLAALVEGREPTDGAIPASLQSADPFASPWSEVAAEVGRVHAELLATFDRGADEGSAGPRAPVVMVVKCQGPDGRLEPVHWIERLDWKAYSLALRVHVLEHVAQIERTLAAVGEG